MPPKYLERCIRAARGNDACSAALPGQRIECYIRHPDVQWLAECIASAPGRRGECEAQFEAAKACGDAPTMDDVAACFDRQHAAWQARHK